MNVTGDLFAARFGELRKTHFLRRLLFLSLLLMPTFVRAGRDTGADFLKIPIGAGPAGVGQAYTALSEGIDALNWNPAGLSRPLSNFDSPLLGASLSHQDQLQENNLDHVGLVLPSSRANRPTFGIDLIRLSYADQETRDENRQKTGSLNASDMAFGLALAQNFGQFQLGGQLKLIRQELAGVQAQGYAIDAGALVQPENSRLGLGFAMRNLGPRMKFIDEEFDLPLTLSAGLSYRVMGPVILAADLHYKPHQKQTVAAFGGQMAMSRAISLRAGYLTALAESVQNRQKSETERGTIGGLSGIAGGIGLRLDKVIIDYAITPFGELGNTQMLTLSTWFGGAKKTPARDNNVIFDETPAEKPAEQTDGTTEKKTDKERPVLILPLENAPYWDGLN